MPDEQSFRDTQQYEEAREYEPDIVVIMFGTNDSKIANWAPQKFQEDYVELIEIF